MMKIGAKKWRSQHSEGNHDDDSAKALFNATKMTGVCMVGRLKKKRNNKQNSEKTTYLIPSLKHTCKWNGIESNLPDRRQ